MFISLSRAIGKRSFLVVLLLLAIGRVDAQTVDGYILTINNDSLLVHIQPFKQGLFSVIDPCYKKVAVIDSVGNTKVYTPKDIKGYGYIYKNFRYNFVSKPIEDGSSLFLTPYVTGNKSSLYMYNLVRNLGASVTYTDYYTFEKGNSQTHFSYLFMDSWAWRDDLKERLLHFYQDTPNIQQILDQRFKKKKNKLADLEYVANAANFPDMP